MNGTAATGAPPPGAPSAGSPAVRTPPPADGAQGAGGPLRIVRPANFVAPASGGLRHCARGTSIRLDPRASASASAALAALSAGEQRPGTSQGFGGALPQ